MRKGEIIYSWHYYSETRNLVGARKDSLKYEDPSIVTHHLSDETIISKEALRAWWNIPPLIVYFDDGHGNHFSPAYSGRKVELIDLVELKKNKSRTGIK